MGIPNNNCKHISSMRVIFALFALFATAMGFAPGSVTMRPVMRTTRVTMKDGPGMVRYGVPVFLKNGSINPEFKKREAEATAKDKLANYNKFVSKDKKLMAKGIFTLGDVQAKQEKERAAGKRPFFKGAF